MTYNDALNDMREVIRGLAKDGKDINEILDMPYHFLIDLLEDKTESMRVVEDDAEIERILDRM